MFEKYVGASPYNYCHGNPIVVVDPDGMDEYEVDPQGYVSKIKECKDHVIYAVDKNGKRTGASKTVGNVKLLEELSGKHDKSLDYEGDYATTKSKEVGNLYTFLASNTDVEWNLSKFKGEIYALGTKHKDAGVMPFYRVDDEVFNVDNLIYNVHSHPAHDGTKGASNSTGWVGNSPPDFRQIKTLAREFSQKKSSLANYNCKYNAKEFPKFFVYHKYSSHLYQYTPYTSSIDMGVVDKNNSLFKRIDGSKNSVYKP